MVTALVETFVAVTIVDLAITLLETPESRNALTSFQCGAVCADHPDCGGFAFKDGEVRRRTGGDSIMIMTLLRTMVHRAIIHNFTSGMETSKVKIVRYVRHFRLFSLQMWCNRHSSYTVIRLLFL